MSDYNGFGNMNGAWRAWDADMHGVSAGLQNGGRVMRRAAKIDANQEEIVAALRRVGASVQSLAPMGHGVPEGRKES